MFPRDKKTLPTSIGPIEAQVSTGKNVVTFRDFEEKNIIKKKKKKNLSKLPNWTVRCQEISVHKFFFVKNGSKKAL
jgi:hypothetical protein